MPTIRCTNCGGESPGDASFCGRCGTPLAATTIGLEVRADDLAGARVVVLRLAAAGLLTAAIIAFGVFLFGGLRHDDEVAATLCVGLGALIIRACVVKMSRRTRRHGFWLDTAQPVLLAGFRTMGGAALVCMFFVSRHIGDEEFLVAFGFLVAAIVFGTVVNRMGGSADAAGSRGQLPPPPSLKGSNPPS